MKLLRYCSKKNSDGTLDTDSKVSLNKYLHGEISGESSHVQEYHIHRYTENSAAPQQIRLSESLSQ